MNWLIFVHLHITARSQQNTFHICVIEIHTSLKIYYDLHCKPKQVNVYKF
jgi:hypothetical protein